MGMLSGARPDGLGWHPGGFKPCPGKPNCVSSTVAPSDTQHHIAPLTFSGTPGAAWKRLCAAIRQRPRVTVVTETGGYLHAEFKSSLMGYVDDAEFFLDARAGAIQARSAARLGVRDFGVNRARIESIRATLAQS